MNRGRSSDSLANSDADIVCSSSGSSSPTDFTSDDETTNNNLYIMSGQPRTKPQSRAQMNLNQTAKIDKYLSSQHYRNDYPLQSHPIIQSSARPLMSSNENRQINFMDDCNGISLNASTSYLDNSPNALQSQHKNITNDPLSSRLPDVLPNQSSIALLPGSPFGDRCYKQADNINTRRSMIRSRWNQSRGGPQSSNDLDGEDGENFGVDPLEQEVGTSRFCHDSPSLEGTHIHGSIRGINNIAIRMCSRLVECRSLRECIEFVEDNRDLIEDVARIVTQEAPAFRNYDVSLYQTDYSVKESFNPHFWSDREPIVTTADGNCQYHAVSLSLTGSEAYTPEVRLATAVAVIDNREWFDTMLKLIDRGSILDLVRTIARSYSWGDETTLKAIAVAINRRIFLYTCNIGKKDYEMVKSLSKEELLDAFKEKKYRGGTGIHTYADPLVHVSANNYIMLFHKSEHFIAVLPTTQQPTMFEPYNPIVPVFD